MIIGFAKAGASMKKAGSQMKDTVNGGCRGGAAGGGCWGADGRGKQAVRSTEED